MEQFFRVTVNITLRKCNTVINYYTNSFNKTITLSIDIIYIIVELKFKMLILNLNITIQFEYTQSHTNIVSVTV